MKKIIITIILLIAGLGATYAATVSHLASQVVPGTFASGEYSMETLTITTKLNASNTRIVDVATPVDDNDAANKAYVDANSGTGNATIENQQTLINNVGTGSDSASMSTSLHAGQQYIWDNRASFGAAGSPSGCFFLTYSNEYVWSTGNSVCGTVSATCKFVAGKNGGAYGEHAVTYGSPMSCATQQYFGYAYPYVALCCY